MSTKLLVAQRSSARMFRAQRTRTRQIIVALLVAAVLTGLPVLTANLPSPVSSFLAPTAQAGCPTGGTCG